MKRPPVSAAFSSLWALSTPTFSSSLLAISRWSAPATVLPGASRRVCVSLDGGFFLSISSNLRRVVTLPVVRSTARSFTFTVFLGILVWAASAFAAAFSALRMGFSNSGSARSASVNCNRGSRFNRRHLPSVRPRRGRRYSPAPPRSPACGCSSRIGSGGSAPCAGSGSAPFPDARRTCRTYSRCGARRW